MLKAQGTSSPTHIAKMPQIIADMFNVAQSQAEKIEVIIERVGKIYQFGETAHIEQKPFSNSDAIDNMCEVLELYRVNNDKLADIIDHLHEII